MLTYEIQFLPYNVQKCQIWETVEDSMSPLLTSIESDKGNFHRIIGSPPTPKEYQN